MISSNANIEKTSTNKGYNIAVIGATGNVGYEILNNLAERNFPVNKIYAVASENSSGKEVSFGDKVLKVVNIDSIDFTDIDIAFFATEAAIVKKYANDIARKGCVVIDKSSLFRLDDDVPLIVPEANIIELQNYKKYNIIASPNCCVIPLAVALKPLDNAAKIKRVVISTYQSTSGAGKSAMDELYNQTKAKYVFEDLPNNVFPRQIAFNLFPQIGEFNHDGYTEEEDKIKLELQKVIGEHIKCSVTCVRVPVFVGHSISVNVEFENDFSASEAIEILEEADSVVLFSNESEQQYACPIDVVGEDGVYVSRVRDDSSNKNTINLWLVTDNLRKGAAVNAVQIAENLIAMKE